MYCMNYVIKNKIIKNKIYIYDNNQHLILQLASKAGRYDGREFHIKNALEIISSHIEENFL